MKNLMKMAAFLVAMTSVEAFGAARQSARVDFASASGYICSQDDTTVCSVTDDEINFLFFDGSNNALTYINTATTDAAAWVRVATPVVGWELPGDNTTAEGGQLTFGGDSGNKCAFAPGVAWYAKATFSLSDCSDYEVAALCMTNDGAFVDVIDEDSLDQATPAYTDFACLTVSDCDYRTYTQDDEATAVDTDITTTSLTDGADTHSASTTTTLMVKGSSAGLVTYTINGTAAAGAVAFTLDQEATDIYVPRLIFAKEGSTSDSPPVLMLFECGLQ